MIRIVNPYQLVIQGIILNAQFLLLLKSLLISSSLCQYCRLTFFSEIISYICNVVKIFWLYSASILWSPDFLHFQNFFIHCFTLCAVKFCGFDKWTLLYSLNCSIIWNIFPCPKNSPIQPFSILQDYLSNCIFLYPTIIFL